MCVKLCVLKLRLCVCVCVCGWWMWWMSIVFVRLFEYLFDGLVCGFNSRIKKTLIALFVFV